MEESNDDYVSEDYIDCNNADDFFNNMPSRCWVLKTVY